MTTPVPIIYATTLGLKLKVTQNSLLLFAKEHPNCIIKRWIIFGSKRSWEIFEHNYISENRWCEQVNQEAKEMGLSLLVNDNIIRKEEIDEKDIPLIATKMTQKINQELSDFSANNDPEIIIDITGGRKAMSVGSIIASHNLAKANPHRNFFILYFWLKDTSRTSLDKKASELFLDEYVIQKWNVNKLFPNG